MRAVPGVALDLFYLGAGERERSVLVSEEERTCVYLALDCGCRSSLCGARAGPCRCERCPRVNQTGRVQLGTQVYAMGLRTEVPCGPWPSLPFYPDPDDSAFRPAILTHP